MNLAVLQFLQQHPGAAPDSLPGTINWHTYNTSFSSAAWEAAQHIGITARMSPAELRQLEQLYYQLGVVQASSAERLSRAISAARRYTASDADPLRLEFCAQLADEIELAEALLIAQYRFGAGMATFTASTRISVLRRKPTSWVQSSISRL